MPVFPKISKKIFVFAKISARQEQIRAAKIKKIKFFTEYSILFVKLVAKSRKNFAKIGMLG
jgi:hypothetical protein